MTKRQSHPLSQADNQTASGKTATSRTAEPTSRPAGNGHSAERNYSIAVDFDGVIHSYTSPWVDAAVIPDPPVPGAIEWLNEISKKFRVIIFTTRGKTEHGQAAVRMWLRAGGFDPGGPIEVTATKPPALIYLDDRAVRFDGEHFPTADEIHRDLIPWNKRR